MIPLDEIAPSYRRARDRWPDAASLVAHYQTVVEAYEGTGQALIESVKSFLESVCITIVVDFGKTVTNDASTTYLLGLALEHLGLRNSRGADKFDKVLSAHNKLADALSDCRNQDGSVAHGKDGFLDALAGHHVRLYLLTGDTILSLLLEALDHATPNLRSTREPYDRFEHFNASIDRNVGVGAEFDPETEVVLLTFRTHGLQEGIQLRMPASRLLYQLDRGAYVEVLESLPRVLDLPGREEREAEAAPTIEAMVGVASVPVDIALVRAYSGPLHTLHGELEAELTARGVDTSTHRGSMLVPSLLTGFDVAAGLDWTTRPAMTARVVVAFKRVLRAADVKRPPAESLAKALADWFAQRAPSGSLPEREDAR